MFNGFASIAVVLVDFAGVGAGIRERIRTSVEVSTDAPTRAVKESSIGVAATRTRREGWTSKSVDACAIDARIRTRHLVTSDARSRRARILNKATTVGAVIGIHRGTTIAVRSRAATAIDVVPAIRFAATHAAVRGTIRATTIGVSAHTSSAAAAVLAED